MSLRIFTFTQPFNNEYRFVLYDNGLVIVQRASEDHLAEYFTAVLSADEMASLLGSLKLPEFLALAAQQPSPLPTDLPLYEITAFDALTGHLRTMSISGFAETAAEPAAFVRVYRALESFANPRERPWFPDYVYVSVTKATERTRCVWPSEWGTLATAGSLALPANEDKRADLGIIREPGDRLTDIQRLLRRCRHLVLLNREPVLMRLTVALPHEAEALADAGVPAELPEATKAPPPRDSEPAFRPLETSSAPKQRLAALAGTWAGTFTLRGTVNGSYSGEITVTVHGDSVQLAHICPGDGQRLVATGSGATADWHGDIDCAPISIVGCSSVVLSYKLATATLDGSTLTVVAAGTAAPTGNCLSSNGEVTVTFVAQK
ncbi:MAG: hypothetical protein ACLPJH_05230 [Myxococcaceae bacterium]